MQTGKKESTLKNDFNRIRTKISCFLITIFYYRAKNIKNKPKINEDPKDAMLREFQEEIARLKSQLSNRKTEKREKSAKRRKSAKRNSTIVSDSGEINDSNRLMESVSSDTSNLSVPMDTSTELESPLVENMANAAELEYQQNNMKRAADEMEHRLAVERELLEADTGMLDNEKQRLLSELSAKESALKAQREEKEKVFARIKALESKLLSGTGIGVTSNDATLEGSGSSNHIVEHTNEQQKKLEKRKADLAEKRKAERSAAQELEAKEEQGEELEKTYSSLQQEAETKTKKLRKLFTKLQSCKQEIVDVTEEYNRDRRDLEDTQQQLLKELKLKVMLIENFIPPNDRKKLLARAAYDEEEDTWYMTKHRNEGIGEVNSNKGEATAAPFGVIMKRPVSAAGSRRPVSEYARMISGLQHSGAAGARYRGENIMRLSLDRGGRTTREYEGPAVAPRVQAALDAAMLNVEPDIEVDVTALSSKTAVRGMRKNSQGGLAHSSTKSSSKSNRLSTAPATAYPASRGLVPK